MRGNPMIASFGDKVGQPMKNAQQLMNWIVYGNTRDKFHF